jgi:hypothetical protein
MALLQPDVLLQVTGLPLHTPPSLASIPPARELFDGMASLCFLLLLVEKLSTKRGSGALCAVMAYERKGGADADDA